MSLWAKPVPYTVMKRLITLSLLLNIAVLIPVCAGLATDASWTLAGYGEATPARDILLSIYLSILLASILLVFLRGPKAVAALLLVQVSYKLTTPFTVESFQNPVVISNLIVTALHLATLISIWRAVGNPFRG